MTSESLVNRHYDDCYFSIDSGYLESSYVFINGNAIDSRVDRDIFIGETGFGTGLNILVLEDLLEGKDLKEYIVTFTTVEKYPLKLDVIKDGISKLNEVSPKSLKRHVELYKEIIDGLKLGWNNFSFKRPWGTLVLNLFYGDVLDSFKEYPVVNDCWFLDGHSPEKNPEMWNLDVFNSIYINSKKGTTFATFTAAGVVKSGLREAGFIVKRRKGWGKKRHMILGYI